MSPYKNKKVAIVGLSVEGHDSEKFFIRVGAIVTRLDRQLGSDYLRGLTKFDLIVRTPGMLLKTPELVEAQAEGVKITSLTKLFFEHCKAKIIGVTGTKGKGTVSTLIQNILQSTYEKVWLGGNVGTPLLSRVHEMKESDVVVLELSSFQLEDLTHSPHIAVVLKITEDHLANFDPQATNFHESRAAYIEAKKSIVRYQSQGDFIIYNADDPTSTSFGGYSPAKKYSFSRVMDTVDSYVKEGKVFLRWNSNIEQICDASDIHVLGTHNLENIAAAALVGAIMNVSAGKISRVVGEFKGLEHRLEFARTVSDVSYYDDSFSTVPDTTIAAIESFLQPIILIAGGSEKKSDYTDLGKHIAHSNVKTLILIGQMATRIRDAAITAGYLGEIVQGLASMHEVVTLAAQKAKQGDVVLLSPACASFGMFTNYKERGKQFKYEVSIL